MKNKVSLSKADTIKSRNVKKKAVTIVAALLLFLLYLTIFSFSEQDGETSSGLSRQVTEKCVDVVDNVAKRNWTKAVKAKLADMWEHPVRKMAHFAEYTIMGILVYWIWRPWKVRDKKLFLMVILWVFISAAFDEFHQTFTVGRDGNPGDVLLDTCGGVFGVILCVITERIYENRKMKKNAR